MQGATKLPSNSISDIIVKCYISVPGSDST